METHDYRVVHARQFLTDARLCDPAALRLADLVREDAELRRCLGWRSTSSMTSLTPR